MTTYVLRGLPATRTARAEVRHPILRYTSGPGKSRPLHRIATSIATSSRPQEAEESVVSSTSSDAYESHLGGCLLTRRTLEQQGEDGLLWVLGWDPALWQ